MQKHVTFFENERASAELTQRPPATWAGEKSTMDFPVLRGPILADHLIIGAGWMGLGAALGLADEDPNKKIVVLDAGEIASAATGRNAGIVLDLAEESVAHLLKRFGKEKTIAILRFGLEAAKGVEQFMTRCGAPHAFRNTGYITGFRTKRERDEFLEGAEFLRLHFPDDYGYVLDTDTPRGAGDDANFILLSPEATGSPEFFPQGGVFNPRGGTLDVPAALRAVITTLQSLPGVTLFEKTPVLDLHAAHKGVFANTDKRNNRGVEAGQVLLAGGATFSLLEKAVADFPKPQPVNTAMFLIEDIPAAIVKRHLAARHAVLGPEAAAIPFQGSATYSPPYGRFVDAGDGTFDFYFGTGARQHAQTALMEKDVLRDLAATYPWVTERLRSGRIKASPIWAGTQYFAKGGVPFMTGLSYGKRGLEIIGLDDNRAPRIYAATGYGGHGIAMASHAGRQYAFFQSNVGKASFHAARLMAAMRGWQPRRPLTEQEIQQAIAKERPNPKRPRKTRDRSDAGRQSAPARAFRAKRDL